MQTKSELNELRARDVDKKVAHDIWSKLRELESKLKLNRRRWVWELIQNAKDNITYGSQVCIEFEFSDNKVVFKHNRGIFTYDNILALINQDTSKDWEEKNEELQHIGQFGTGFLTTLLLSKLVTLEGIYSENTGGLSAFKIEMDRETDKKIELIPKIKDTWEQFVDNRIPIVEFDQEVMNTIFTYSIKTEKNKEAMNIGKAELINYLPHVLTCIDGIEWVKIIDKRTNELIIFNNQEVDYGSSLTNVKKILNGEETNNFFLVNKSTDMTVFCKLTQKNDSYFVEKLGDKPKLFCDFPLIGTDNFHFPIFINSGKFQPNTERNAIILNETDEGNRNHELIITAKELYKKLIEFSEDKPIFHMFNMVSTNLSTLDKMLYDIKWLKEIIIDDLRKFLLQKSIIRQSIDTKVSPKDIYLPSNEYTTEQSKKAYEFYKQLEPDYLSLQDDFISWGNVSWTGWDYLNINIILETIEKYENLNNLSKGLNLIEEDTVDWLNKIVKFTMSVNNSNSILHTKKILPNKEGEFKNIAILVNSNRGQRKRRYRLYKDEIEHEKFIEILNLLGENWDEILLHHGIDDEFLKLNILDNGDISNKIVKNIKLIHPNNPKQLEIEAYLQLLDMRNKNEDEFYEYFSGLSELLNYMASSLMATGEILLYQKLSKKNIPIETILKLIDKFEENPDILDENSSGSIENDLNDDIMSSVENIGSDLPIDEYTLVALNIYSEEEFLSFDNPHLKHLFEHHSEPTLEMYLRAKEIRDNAIKKVKDYMNRPDNPYDISEMDAISETAFAGVKKNGLDISILIRPSDDNYVVVYDNTEQQVLSLPSTELWIANGNTNPLLLTLGKILKDNKIRRIPVK